MNKHFTRGRGGAKIECVVIHHNAGILSIDQIWQVWQTRAASAHYQVESGGRIGQLVWDRDTAWHAANAWINQRSIGIEVSNSGGAAQDWPISPTAIRESARLAAAVCAYYKLGRPVSGKNIRWHREFTSTSCPYHLAPGGKYHNAFMSEAQRFYDQLVTPAPKPSLKAAPKKAKEKLVDKAQADRIERLLTLVLDQLAGPARDAKGPKFTGWPQLGGKTLVDAVADIRNALNKEEK
ncbi:peptidoglycan recognition protein family protein [Corynebacterium urealyticum]|uniref:peptidoglycan recognition protein family protein n=1 Tax=Corynebacterium urealyticum TaxID=43771 RepID=UPI0011E68FA2|nr:peptidoglycan recognition family protein [Corynebacterium urealyticum]TYR15638.1 N-acetylmuramoyl-L-alanine amidase [Corynebacterium urealyticum]TYR17974.1 N-acetylmuramoyl-L-alanine amidase [Corynebacterium urealyticum]